MQEYIYIWRFPERGAPPNHPFWGIHIYGNLHMYIIWVHGHIIIQLRIIFGHTFHEIYQLISTLCHIYRNSIIHISTMIRTLSHEKQFYALYSMESKMFGNVKVIWIIISESINTHVPKIIWQYSFGLVPPSQWSCANPLLNNTLLRNPNFGVIRI